ncbi:uncharacterized protein LOC128998952 [Macrosteles quadrilineatus]|nr:uncharacterized protein LOC128998952 [Macrosteles quadrilineatus]
MGTIVTYTKSIFARHGVPETVRADCGSQFDCCQFKQLGHDYGFKLITSSPKFPKSNGFIEAQVKNLKYHLDKRDDPHKMLLMLRATPPENGKSPAELLFGRRIRTYVPIMSDQLRPYLVDPEKLREKEEARIDRQKIYFDKRHRATELPTLPDGAQVHIKDRNQEATILNKHHAPRSYIIQTQDGCLRRNRRSLQRFSITMPSEHSQPALQTSPSEHLRRSEPFDHPAMASQANPLANLRRSTRQFKPTRRLDL